jgi:quercetin dioxygenase-like cupin family protein
MVVNYGTTFRITVMKNLRLIAAASLLSFAAGAGAMWAQQQAQASRREPQFENDQLKVWKSIIMPKQPLTLHRHDHGRALIALTDGQLKVIDKGGKLLNTYNWARGKAYWLDADPAGQMHADVNDTSKPIEVIVVELKKDR